MCKVWYMFLIGRPINGLITAISVVAAGLLLRDVPPLPDLCIAALGAAFVCGFGNALNDSVDCTADRVNKPDRLIPSGLLSVRLGCLSAAIHLIAGAILALTASVTCFVIAVAAAVLLLGYGLFGRRLPLLANAWVATISALAFVYAAAVAGDWRWEQIKLAVLGAAFAFLFHLGREIVKDIEDVAGDEASGTRTLPIAAGVHVSKAVVFAVFAVLLAAMFLAYLSFDLSIWYLIFSAVFILIPLIDILWRLAVSSRTQDFRRVQFLLKAVMPFGLAVLLIARYAV
jgi:4-hydroxybenzoate polyprenyltransferase